MPKWVSRCIIPSRPPYTHIHNSWQLQVVLFFTKPIPTHQDQLSILISTASLNFLPIAINRNFLQMNNAKYILQLRFVFSLCWWLNKTYKITLKINLKMNFVATIVTRKLNTCCRRVVTFLLRYFPHKGTWILTWKFTTKYKQHNTPLVLRVCHLMTRCLVNYKLWEFHQEDYNSFWKNTSKRERRTKNSEIRCV